MKITKTQLKQIIKEELSKELEEGYDIETGVPYMSPEEVEIQKIEDDLEKHYADPEERGLRRQELVAAGVLPAREH
tara:strand:- start:644 stop:871 length:228 start_codon:yes stop_codon:yes gene_type:complete